MPLSCHIVLAIHDKGKRTASHANRRQRMRGIMFLLFFMMNEEVRHVGVCGSFLIRDKIVYVYDVQFECFCHQSCGIDSRFLGEQLLNQFRLALLQ